jgi:hypothetical protein
MTPIELQAYSKGYAKRETDDYRRIIYSAYITARLGRVKDFPDIEELLSPLETNDDTYEQTPEEMLAIIRDFDKQLKGTRG